MDLVTQTSLEALLLKATNPQNQNIDTAAVDAFCTIVNKEKDGAYIGAKVLANRLPTGNEKEMLQTLNILDICMGKCGTQFQSEVGKFRFLNEMIKLVSPKYLGSHTPLIVKQKVLQLMYVWTIDYPKESKIKEAYDMLRKQGVIKDVPLSSQNIVICKKKPANSVFQDEEKSRILQKLLQSKDPEDIQAANWLIKSMVKEDDKRAELKSRRISELESIQNNIRLLNEMLDSYKTEKSSSDEFDLIKELHQSCERLRPNLMRLATETQEEILGDVLQTSDDLGQVFQKYDDVIVKGLKAIADDAKCKPLLDFDAANLMAASTDAAVKCQDILTNEDEPASQVDALCDIFTSSIADGSAGAAAGILQPMMSGQFAKTFQNNADKKKLEALEDLDVLSEHLSKECLSPASMASFNKTAEKIPMNLLPSTVPPDSKKSQNVMKTGLSFNDSLNLDLNYLINSNKEVMNREPEPNSDDFLVNIADEKMLGENDLTTVDAVKTNQDGLNDKLNIKLGDILIRLEDIKPSNVPPLTIMNEKNGITISLHLAKDKPRDDVHVFVITTISKNQKPISNYLFQAVVPKGCKLKLQAPSSTSLPAFNSFLPPSAITQIMLIACSDNVQIYLKFIVSYTVDDETMTEMGEVDNLPLF